jgi:hypothetical protein
MNNKLLTDNNNGNKLVVCDSNAHESILLVFIKSCAEGKKEFAQWLYESEKNSNRKINIRSQNDSAFRSACLNNHYETALWLYQLLKSENGISICHNNKGKEFFELCQGGYKDAAQWLYKLSIIKGNPNGRININYVSSGWRLTVFEETCGRGHLEIAKWLYELSKIDGNTKIDLHRTDEYAFREACYHNHIDTAKWLYELSKVDGNTKININVSRDNTFYWACYNGNLQLAKWLYEISKIDGNRKIDIHTMGLYDNRIFDSVVRVGKLDVAKWLYNIYKVDGNQEIDLNTIDSNLVNGKELLQMFVASINSESNSNITSQETSCQYSKLANNINNNNGDTIGALTNENPININQYDSHDTSSCFIGSKYIIDGIVNLFNFF